jgi:hypothetical protein
MPHSVEVEAAQKAERLEREAGDAIAEGRRDVDRHRTLTLSIQAASEA